MFYRATSTAQLSSVRSRSYYLHGQVLRDVIRTEAKINNSGLLVLGYTQLLNPGVKASFGVAIDTQKLSQSGAMDSEKPAGAAHSVGASLVLWVPPSTSAGSKLMYWRVSQRRLNIGCWIVLSARFGVALAPWFACSRVLVKADCFAGYVGGSCFSFLSYLASLSHYLWFASGSGQAACLHLCDANGSLLGSTGRRLSLTVSASMVCSFCSMLSYSAALRVCIFMLLCSLAFIALIFQFPRHFLLLHAKLAAIFYYSTGMRLFATLSRLPSSWPSHRLVRRACCDVV